MPVRLLWLTVKSATSDEFPSTANENFSITLTLVGSEPPALYPEDPEELPAIAFLAAVRSPTSVALPSAANGNLSITLLYDDPGKVGANPPLV